MQVPAWRSRAQRFDDHVLDAVESLPTRFTDQVARIEFAVEDVPPDDPAPWEERQVPLSRMFPADRELPPRIVLYRRPVEARSTPDDELADVVQSVVIEQVAEVLGVPPEELDPGTP